MRRTLIALFGLVGMTVAASAADYRPPPPMPVVPIFTWTGFYVGVNAGIAWADNNNNAVFVPAGTGGIFLTDVFVPGIGGSNDAVFAGGGQIGYNWQGAGGWVFGIEADLQWADLGQSNRPLGFGIVGVPAGFTFAATNTGVEWFGTVRGRVGYAWDRTLLYATGGFAFGGGGRWEQLLRRRRLRLRRWRRYTHRLDDWWRSRIRLHQQLDGQDRGSLREPRRRRQQQWLARLRQWRAGIPTAWLHHQRHRRTDLWGCPRRSELQVLIRSGSAG